MKNITTRPQNVFVVLPPQLRAVIHFVLEDPRNKY